MLKLKIRCLSKNTGEVFYEYDSKYLSNLEIARQKLSIACSVFLKRLMSDIKEDCTFEFSVLHVKEELPIFNDNEEHFDFNDPPVVF